MAYFFTPNELEELQGLAGVRTGGDPLPRHQLTGPPPMEKMAETARNEALEQP